MICRTPVFSSLRWIAAAGFAGLALAWLGGANTSLGEEHGKTKLPSFSTVRKIVEHHFAQQKDRRPGDLIWRSSTTPIFKQLEEHGWKVANRDKIQSAMLPDSSFMVQIYGTGDGRDFLRDCARYPAAYDRIDHLSRLPQGELIVRRLIAGPDGYKMLEYMTTASGGEALGEQLSASPHGADFNDRTGRIYTVEQFISRLQKSYNDAVNPPKHRGR